MVDVTNLMAPRMFVFCNIMVSVVSSSWTIMHRTPRFFLVSQISIIDFPIVVKNSTPVSAPRKLRISRRYGRQKSIAVATNSDSPKKLAFCFCPGTCSWKSFYHDSFLRLTSARSKSRLACMKSSRYFSMNKSFQGGSVHAPSSPLGHSIVRLSELIFAFHLVWSSLGTSRNIMHPS